MVFTVDVGNTNIVISAYKNDELKFMSRVATEAFKMEDQYAVEFNDIIKLYGYDSEDFSGSIISSVVPPLVPVLKSALKKLFKAEPFVVGPGIKTGLNIKIDDPASLGADFVCEAVGALGKYELPCIIIDMGTATTIAAINRKGEFLGGSVMPGVMISLETLSNKTAQLPHINLQFDCDMVIGANTIDCMKSGVILGAASMIDGMIERYREVLGDDMSVIVTGGLSKGIIRHCRTKDIIYDPNIVTDGLYSIYKRNVK